MQISHLYDMFHIFDQVTYSKIRTIDIHTLSSMITKSSAPVLQNIFSLPFCWQPQHQGLL